MIERRPFESLGGANHGWLNAKHHFSFANYYDPKRMSWGNLRVWNDDEIAAGTGFPPHPHADMEIITYVREGAITHEDEPDLTRIFQIWIEPTRRGDAPSWGTKPFPKGERSGQFVVLASGFDGDKDALPIRTDARIVAATLKAGDSADYPLGVARRAYLVPAKGELEVNGVRLNARDGAAIAQEDVVTVKALSDAEIVLVDAA